MKITNPLKNLSKDLFPETEVVDVSKVEVPDFSEMKGTLTGTIDLQEADVPEEIISLVTGTDMVNHPPHYTHGDMEVIDFIESVLMYVPENIRYHIGNVIKYVCRAPFKNGVEDLDKALWYANRAGNRHKEIQPNVSAITIAPAYLKFIDSVGATYNKMLAPSIVSILSDCFYEARLPNVIDELTYTVAQAKALKTIK